VATAMRPRKPRRPKRPGKTYDRIVFNGDIRLPAQFPDLESFRRWCRSPDYPERGDVFWIGGTLWVSAEMEQAYTHNLIKMAIGAALTLLVQNLKSGHVFGDRMRLSNPAADLSCEPDLMYVSFATLAAGAVRQIPASTGGVIEFEGSPDMVLEVTSDSSATKDLDLRELYYAAGIKEYWVVDARGAELRFDILRRGPKGFVTAARRQGQVRSAVFGRSFQVLTDNDPLGNPTFLLHVSE
jgi:Uma2 family endonuclease